MAELSATDEPRSRKPARARAATADTASATPNVLAAPAQIAINWSESATHALKSYVWQRAKDESAGWNRTTGKYIYNASQGAKRAHNLVARQAIKLALQSARPLYPALQIQLKSIENPQWELDIAFTDDETMQRLNADTRGKNQPTDVLSFPVWEGETFPFPSGQTNVMLGDVVISIETAARQAQELKHDLRAELAFLAVHGALHLLGYDHGSDSQRRKMFALQDEIVAIVREDKKF